MKLDEAIRIDTVLKGAPVLKDAPRIVEALNLSIEALKQHQLLRMENKDIRWLRLPGETD